MGKQYTVGAVTFNNMFEVGMGAPLDNREVVEYYADLESTIGANKYVGEMVYVINDTSQNGSITYPKGYYMYDGTQWKPFNESSVDIEVGGRNLLPNTRVKHFNLYGSPTVTFIDNVIVTEWNASDGIRAVGTKGTNYIYGTYQSPYPQQIAHWKAKQYVVSMYVKNLGQTRVCIQSNGNSSKRCIWDVGEVGRKYFVIDGSSITGSNIGFNFVDPDNVSGYTFDFVYWHPKIEEGNIPTDWLPATEDTLCNELISNEGSRLVIALCELTAGTTTNTTKGWSGNIIASRNSTGDNFAHWAKIDIMSKKDIDNGFEYTLITTYRNTSSSLSNTQGFRACRFQYTIDNVTKWFGGLEFYDGWGNRNFYTQGVSIPNSFTPFIVKYATVSSSTATAVNSEIYNSIDFSTTSCVERNVVYKGTLNGYTLGKSVPSNAVFTDTTYDVVTQSANGLMLSTDKKKLDELAIGGRNLLKGTATLTIDTTDTTWAYGKFYKSNSGGSIENVSLPSTPIPSVMNGIKITITTANTEIGFAQSGVPLRKQTMTQSVWVKGNVGDIVRLQPLYSDASGSREGGDVTYTITDTDWHRYIYTKTPNYDHTSGIRAGYVYVKSATVGNILYICADQLEYGTLATDWTPAPEDMVSKVDTYVSSGKGYINGNEITTISGNAATATTATKLGTSSFGNPIKPFYLNAGVPTACDIYRYHYDSTSDYASYAWHKVAYAVAAAQTDKVVTFFVTTGAGVARNGILKCRARWDAESAFNSSSTKLNWAVNNGIDVNDFIFVWKSPNVELWCKMTERYGGYHFTVLDSGNRAGNGISTWTLCDSISGHGSASYTTGGTVIISTNATLTNNINGTVNGCSIAKSVPSDAVFTDHYDWADITNKPLTLTKNATGFSISGGTTSKTLTVGADYTLGAACAKAVDSSIAAASTSTNLPTSKAVATFVEGKNYLTSVPASSKTVLGGVKVWVESGSTDILRISTT